jgi:hypothetical protein
MSMEFLVSWKGYSAKNDTWEPYKAVCKTQAFVDYYLANKQTPLVNKALRGEYPTGLQLRNTARERAYSCEMQLS